MNGQVNHRVAQHYRLLGLWVFPCVNRVPVMKGGFKTATNDPKQIEWFWRRWPDAQPACWPGPSRLAVLDVDVKHGKPGLGNFIRLDGCPILPPVPTVRTPSGGWHFYFLQPDERISATVDRPDIGLDWRGDGGYVVLPSPGSAYSWSDWHFGNSEPKLPSPGLLPTACAPRSSPVEGSIRAGLDLSQFAERKLDGALRFLETAQEGERNNVLFWTACVFRGAVREGVISEADSRLLLEHVANDIGLDQREAVATINSAFRRE